MATLYVNSDYNSSTEGYGVTKFSSYSSALAYASTNAKNATIVMEKTTTISGNCIDHNTHKTLKNLNVVVQDDAVMGNANSKWDLTYDFTIEAGGKLQSARGTGSGVGNTHIKDGGSLTIGEAGSAEKAVVDFHKGTYQNMSIAVLWQGKLEANNAIIKVGDFGFTGTANFTDCEVAVNGIAAFGKGFYNQTMTNTTMTIKGHNLMNENTYYSTTGTLLNKLTMTNSSIIIDDGVDGTAAEKVTIKALTMNDSAITVEDGTEVIVAGAFVMNDGAELTAGDIEISGGSISMSSSAKLNAASITGTGTITIDATGFDGVSSLMTVGAIDEGITFNVTGNEDAEIVVDKNGNISLSTVDTSVLYVNSDWAGAEAGKKVADGKFFGVNAFAGYGAAFDYAKENAPEATLVIEKSGAYDPNNALNNSQRNYPDMDIIVKDGADFCINGNSMKITHDLTIEAGAEAYTNRGGYWGNVQIEGNLIVGKADADKTAVVNFDYSEKGKESLVVKEGATMTANNAELNVGDFAANGATVINDSVMNVAGTLAFGFEKYSSGEEYGASADHAISGSQITVAGSAPGSDSSYYQDNSLLNKLTMTDSSITFTDADNVDIADIVMNGSAIANTDAKGFISFIGEAVLDSGSSIDSAYVIDITEDAVVKVNAGSFISSGSENFNVDGVLEVTGNADFAAASADISDRQLAAFYIWQYGSVNLKNTYATAYSQLRVRNGGSLKLDNALLEVGRTNDGEWKGNPASNAVGWMRVHDGAELIVANNSVLRASGANGGGGNTLTVDSGASVVIDGAEAEFGAGIANNGTITVANGILKVGTEFVDFTTGQPSFAFTNNGTFSVSGNSALQISNYSGDVITLAGGTVLSDTAITVKAELDSKIVANGDLTVNANAFTNFDLITIAGDLAITGADLTVDGIVLAGTVDVAGAIVSVNGYEVVEGVFNDGSNVYSVTNTANGISIAKGAAIDQMSGKVTGYKQSANDDYLFTIDCEVTGGEGEKVYSAEVYNNGTLVDVVTSSTASGIKFALTDPAFDNVTVDVFVSDKYNKVQIANDYKVSISDYTAPKFNVKVATAEVSEKNAVISWEASDNFGVASYIVEVNGEKTYLDGSVTSLELNDLANGDYAVKITAIDAAGNQKVSETDFIVNVTRPVDAQPGVLNDFDGDSKSDVVIGTAPVFKVLASEAAAATGEFKNAAISIIEDGWKVIGTGYFNEDNVADILVQNTTTGDIEAVFMNYADGKFSGSQESLDIEADGWTFAATGDVNADGIDDLVFTKDHGTFTEVAAFESQYDGSFKQTGSLGGINDASAWTMIAVADMDGDNKDDVVWMNKASQEVGYWSSVNRDAAANAKAGETVDATWKSIAAGASDWAYAGIGDFDNDGVAELLWQNETDGLVGFWQETAAGTDDFFTSLGFAGEMKDFSISAVGDYNGDGKDDILWTAANGEQKAWIINENDYSHTVSIIAC